MDNWHVLHSIINHDFHDSNVGSKVDSHDEYDDNSAVSVDSK